MAKRAVPRLGKRTPIKAADPVEVLLETDGVTVTFPPDAASRPEALALLIDGRVLTTQAAGDGPAVHLALPDWQFGTAIQVVGVPDGRPLHPHPIDLNARRSITWLGWTSKAPAVSGTFLVGGDLVPSPASAIPVEILQEGHKPRLCFARPSESDEPGTWRFETFLAALPAVGGSIVLAARVGGVDIGTTFAIAQAVSGLAGHVDQIEGRAVQGWAVNLGAPGTPLEVLVEVHGTEIWRGVPSDLREDIRAFGLGDGKAGFRVGIPKSLPSNIELEVAVTLAGTGTHLVGSPYRLAASAPVVGYFDALEGPFAGGWAVNMHDPDSPLLVEAVCDGEVVGSGTADLFRGDVEKAGLPTARCGFRFLLERPLAELFDRDIHLRITGTDLVLGGSPRQISQNGNIVRFLTRSATMPAPTLQRLSRRFTHQTTGFTISIVMPVYNTKREWLMEAINSVLGQWSANWELICVDDGSTEPHVADILAAASRLDRRIRVMRSPGNLGIARATNFGLRAARGPYVAFMDHDDTLEPDAVYKLASAAKTTGADLIYSDEAITTDDIGSIIEVRARPAFSYDYYLSHPYFVHMVAVRTEIAQRLNGWDETLAISADVDFILRVIESAKVVSHVPSVLYRWRTHSTSTGHSKQAEVTETMTGILDRHFARRGLGATAHPGMRYNEYRIDWPDDGGEVLIVIPTKNRVDLLKTCIDSIEKTSAGENYRIVVIDHQSTDKKTVRYLKSIEGRHTIMPYSGIFNYALMNNLAVKTHGGNAKYFLFMNNDVEAIEKGWIARLRSLAARPTVGAVGCLLLYGDDRVQHAGVLVGFSGAADHAMKFQDAYLSKGNRHPGYNCSLNAVRDYSAVTAACLMVSAPAWRAVDGFDEAFVVGFNDTDLCLRIGDAGYKVLYDGFTVLYHHESATRTQSDEVDHPEDDARLRTRWQRFFTKGDPFYNPMLAPRGTDHTLRQDPLCKGRMGARSILTTPVPVSASPAAKPNATKRRGRTPPP